MSPSTPGNVYVAGTTRSPDWITGGFDASFNGGNSDIFLVKLTPAGGYVWGTYLGGGMGDRMHSWPSVTPTACM